MFAKHIKQTILTAVVLGSTVAGASALFVPSSQATTPDSGTSSAYGLEVLLAGSSAILPPTPTSTLGSNGAAGAQMGGTTATASLLSLPLLPLAEANALTTSTSSTNFGAANEAITASAGAAGDFTVDGVNLFNALDIQAVNSTCTSDAAGSTASTAVVAIGGATSPPTEGSTSLPVPGGLDAVIASIDTNVQTTSTVPGSTSISVIGLQVTLLPNVLGQSGLLTVNLAESSCAATGPDIDVQVPTIASTGLNPTSGPTTGGTTVTITGTNFVPGDTTASVVFGTTPATDVDVVNSTTVTAVDPAHAAGPVSVTFADSAGVATAAQQFTYVAPTTGPTPIGTPPIVIGISPSSGPPGGGETVTIGGSNLCGATSVLFGSTPATITGVSTDCTTLTVTEPPGSGSVPVSVTTPGGTAESPYPFTYIAPGYWEAGGDGGVFSFGGAQFYGSVPQYVSHLNSPIVTMADTPDHGGYWLFAADGGVFAFGDAQFFGSVPGVLGPEGRHLNGPIVAAQASPDGLGYRMFAADGGVFDFGDAYFTGSLPGENIVPPSPITAAASAPIGQGYWLSSSNGAIYSFGVADANVGTAAGAFFGKVVALAATPTGQGLYLFLQSGAVAHLGDAVGGLGGGGATSPIVFGEDTSTGQGYWEFSANGTVVSYGDAPNLGGTANIPLNSPITSGIAFGAISPGS
jgi:IPT/TIG domain